MSRNLKFSQMFHQQSNSNLLTVSYVLLKMLKGSKSHFAFLVDVFNNNNNNNNNHNNNNNNNYNKKNNDKNKSNKLYLSFMRI